MRFQPTAQKWGGKGGMVYVGVSRNKDDIDLIPASSGHFVQ